MRYHKCDDCGERFDRTEVVFDDNAGVTLCLDCDAELRDQEARQAYAEYAPRPALAGGYDLDDPKHPTYAERAWGAADERVVFA
jgi:hypothetical protein